MCMFHFFESRFLPPITQKEPNTRRRLHPYATVNARGGKNTRSTFSQVTWKKSAQSTTSCLPAQKKIISPFNVLRSRKAETPKKKKYKTAGDLLRNGKKCRRSFAHTNTGTCDRTITSAVRLEEASIARGCRKFCSELLCPACLQLPANWPDGI